MALQVPDSGFHRGCVASMCTACWLAVVGIYLSNRLPKMDLVRLESIFYECCVMSDDNWKAVIARRLKP